MTKIKLKINYTKYVVENLWKNGLSAGIGAAIGALISVFGSSEIARLADEDDNIWIVIDSTSTFTYGFNWSILQ